MPFLNKNKVSLADRCLSLCAGCDFDARAVDRWGLDLPRLRKLAEAYRSGWLHNVLSRITPLTLRSADDYAAMADIFIMDADSANALLDKFEADLELFCSLADVCVEDGVAAEDMVPELEAHLTLYNRVAGLLQRKFGIEARNPLETISLAPINGVEADSFVRHFVEKRFVA
jgi:hypothetical protein